MISRRMTVHLDHLLVPVHDRRAAGELLGFLLDVPWGDATAGPFTAVYVNDGLTLDKQRHLQPIWGAGDEGEVLEVLAAAAGVESGDIAGYDVLAADTAAPQRFGRDGAFFASGRMDNLSSVYAGLVALLAAPADAWHFSVLAAFDH